VTTGERASTENIPTMKTAPQYHHVLKLTQSDGTTVAHISHLQRDYRQHSIT